MFATRCLFVYALVLALPVAADLPPQEPLPTKAGQSFVVDNFDFKVTQTDMGVNFFSGNMGSVSPSDTDSNVTSVAWVRNPADSTDGMLALNIDFTGQPDSSFGGYFLSLFGLTDTLVSLDGSGDEPETATAFPGGYLDFDDFFRGFGPWPDRSIDAVLVSLALQTGSPPVTVKIELRDENNYDIFARIGVASEGMLAWPLERAAFSGSVTGNGTTAGFRWNRVSQLTLMVEKHHAVDNVTNPDVCGILVDDIALVDLDGVYPDLSAAAGPDGELRPRYTKAFLDHVRRLSWLYFMDFASSDTRTGGMIQDRGSFADLVSIGGVGFQLSAYVIGAERGYMPRTSAVERVHSILTVLDTHPQGTNRVGTLGYKGFFYHFAGIDGLRKQNFDVEATPDVDEAANTVELSSIDTSLALAGVIAAGRYFQNDTAREAAIRRMASNVVARVQWPFMTATLTNGMKQVYLGWKPIEQRDDSDARFLLPDADGSGHYSSRSSGTNEFPATLDYYTDEALLIALLAMASPTPSNRLDRAVWDDIIRDGAPFVKTYPGALFTYQFLGCWVDTFILGPDNHARRPTDLFANTTLAIEGARAYAISNAATAGYGSNGWSLTACEGPYDRYFAEGAPNIALADYGTVHRSAQTNRLEAEDGVGDGFNQDRTNVASSDYTRRFLDSGMALDIPVTLSKPFSGSLVLAYYNDGDADTLRVSVDGTNNAQFTGHDYTFYGNYWSSRFQTNLFEELSLATGTHTIAVTVVNTDSHGVDVDYIDLVSDEHIRRDLDSGTLAPYGAGSSILHAPQSATEALWHMARVRLNDDGVPDLLHPRFGFVDAYNHEIANARMQALDTGDPEVLRTSGAWLNPTGFAIDHGPMLIMLDNYLGDRLIPRLFMNDPNVHRALVELFATSPDIIDVTRAGENALRIRWKGAPYANVMATDRLAAPFDTWQRITATPATNRVDVPVQPSRLRSFRVIQAE